MLEIKTGVPIPKGRKFGRDRKYPFADMNVGDCFDMPVTSDNPYRTQTNILSSLRHQKLTGLVPIANSFTTRFIKGEGVIRTWRTK